MQQNAGLPFGRIVDEFARWRAVDEKERSPAPAWWWGPALEVLYLRTPLPAEWCATLGVPGGATYADGAAVFLDCFNGQTSLRWPDDFPRKPRSDLIPKEPGGA